MLPIAVMAAALGKAGLGLLAKAAAKRGTEYLKEKTGIDLGGITLDSNGNIPEDQIVALKNSEMEHEEALQNIALEKFKVAEQEDTKKMETVNDTMKAETQAKNWWSSAWRPFWGFASAIAFVILVCFVCYLAYKAIADNDSDALTMIPQLVFAFTGLFAIPGGILGVTAWHRGAMQRGK